MKIANVLINDERYLGIIKENKIYPFEAIGIMEDSLEDLIQEYTLDDLKQLVKSFKDSHGIDLKDAKYLAPIEYPYQDVLCLGLNYAEHVKESSNFKNLNFSLPENPVYFSKRVNKAIGDMDYIDGHFDMVDSLDYECELAVIIGKDAYKVDKKNYKDYIFGYTIINDVSARNVQNAHKQWHLGKSLDTFCPMGPVVITADEIDENNLNVKSYINGELRQNSNTSNFIFKIDYVLEDLTKGMTLEAGSIISTGTPQGVGMGFTPPKFLKSGDKIECVIEGIGTLTNIVK